MGEVKRYGPVWYPGDDPNQTYEGVRVEMEPWPTERYVLHSDYAALEAKLAALEAKLAASEAACAAKDAAIRLAFATAKLPKAARDAMMAALPDDAGKGWIDASGAVESHCYIYVHEKYPDGPSVVRCRAPDDWAGSKVKIVRVKP